MRIKNRILDFSMFHRAEQCGHRYPVRDAILTDCKCNLSFAFSTERSIPNGILRRHPVRDASLGRSDERRGHRHPVRDASLDRSDEQRGHRHPVRDIWNLWNINNKLNDK